MCIQMKWVELAVFNQSELCIMMLQTNDDDQTVILEKYEEVKCATQPQQTKQ